MIRSGATPIHVNLHQKKVYVGPNGKEADQGIPVGLCWQSVFSNARSCEFSTHAILSFGSTFTLTGSFRVLQRYALRASTAAPTVFKPVMMGGEMYCDGGIVSSNPAAIAVHEARSVFPDVPIELVVSVGTGAFMEVKNPPRLGWDGIVNQVCTMCLSIVERV
jgi:hypothetical protein